MTGEMMFFVAVMALCLLFTGIATHWDIGSILLVMICGVICFVAGCLVAIGTAARPMDEED